MAATSFASTEGGTNKAFSQSILDAPHTSPTVFNPSEPIVMFCIQAGIIIILSRLLSFGLKRFRQPRVVSDVIAGVILGPSALGQIPNFSSNIFPTISIPYLNLVSNIGLVLFLFLVGLEVDFALVRKNAKSATAISFAGLIIPFACGSGVAAALYGAFIDANEVTFGHFLLFVGTAMSITALPVLARILTELDLMKTNVGIVVLAAGVSNDVVAWVLLALSVALVNSGTGVSAVYVLLCGVGWTLLLIFLVRPIFLLVVRKSGSLETGVPTKGVMLLIVLLILASSFVTQIIGIAAIFGGFLVGLIMPHSPQFTHSVTEKIEDLVTVLFLPIYFALSGLNTNLTLLNNGQAWGYVFLVIVVAFCAKAFSCFAAARWSGYTFRESAAVGSLMSCKGLVELIVLNIGYQAGILTQKVFTIFVVEALVLTFASTPLCLAFYPVWYRVSLAQERAAALKDKTGDLSPDSRSDDDRRGWDRLCLVMLKFEHLSPAMNLCRLFRPSPVPYAGPESGSSISPDGNPSPTISTDRLVIDALRLMELDERTSAVMRAANVDTYAKKDQLMMAFTTFASLSGIVVKPHLSIADSDVFYESVKETAVRSNAIILPWALSDSDDDDASSMSYLPSTPLENLFGQPFASNASPIYAAFVRKVFLESPVDVGLYLDRGISQAEVVASPQQHLFLPFCGGPDDRACLELVVRMCRSRTISATVIRLVKSDNISEDTTKELGPQYTTVGNDLTVHAGAGADTVYEGQHHLASDTADNVLIARLFEAGDIPTDDRATLSRMAYEEVATATPLATLLERLQTLVNMHGAQNVTVLAGRSRRQAGSHRLELATYLKTQLAVDRNSLGIARSTEVRKTLGDVGSALVVSRLGQKVLIIQKALGGSSREDV